MITDADIKKLKAVFATKDDIMSLRRDMVSMEKRLKKEIVGAVVDYLQENIIPILNEHDKRLDRLEKRVGGFPAVA